MPDPFDKILGDGDTPATDEPKVEYATKEDLDNINTNLQTLTDSLATITEKMQPPTEPEDTGGEEPYNPSKPGYTWDAVRNDWIKDAEEVVEAKLAEKEQERQEFLEEEQRTKDTIDKDFNDQLGEIEKDGLIPPVKDENNFEDPGRVARREIFGFAASEGTLNLKRAAKTLKIMHDNGYAFDNKVGDFIKTRTSGWGRSAPVGSSSSKTMASKGPVDYKTIHNNSIDRLIELSDAS